jgi:hypothetical protein
MDQGENQLDHQDLQDRQDHLVDHYHTKMYRKEEYDELVFKKK